MLATTQNTEKNSESSVLDRTFFKKKITKNLIFKIFIKDITLFS